jgi:hypothetical protein
MNSERITRSGNFDKRPLWFSLLNASWKATYPLGTKIKLDKDEMIKAARKVTGLVDLGKEFSDESLVKLLQSVNEEANLHPVGRFITRQRFISLLSIRLRAEYFFHRYPAILEQQLYPAWIIVGLQRTGTTKLQRLLAADPDHRVIPSWEVINPVPLTLDEKADRRGKNVSKGRKINVTGFLCHSSHRPVRAGRGHPASGCELSKYYPRSHDERSFLC